MKVKRIEDNAIFTVWKYLNVPAEKHEVVYCHGWDLKHVIGVDCEYLDESPAPVDAQPNGDEVVKVMDEFKEENLSDRCFSVYRIRKLLNLLLGEEISMSRFVELLNEKASRQPEIDALKKRVEELESEKKPKGWCTSSIECPICTKEWQAVYPNGATELECPNCSNMVQIK